MSCGFGQFLRRVFCLLAIFGVLVAGTAGCGGGPKTDEAAGKLPTGVKKSNDSMENFMKSQKAKK
jgi:hypothetical protein